MCYIVVGGDVFLVISHWFFLVVRVQLALLLLGILLGLSDYECMCQGGGGNGGAEERQLVLGRRGQQQHSGCAFGGQAPAS